MTKLLGFTMLLMGSAGFAMAGFTVPEIEPASGIAAVALLSGGLLVLRGRRKKQTNS
jgi:LPXTG-motif cell wall-anchored protein